MTVRKLVIIVRLFVFKKPQFTIHNTTHSPAPDHISLMRVVIYTTHAHSTLVVSEQYNI